MSLVALVPALIIVGVLLWLVNKYAPMDAKFKKILNLVTHDLIIVSPTT